MDELVRIFLDPVLLAPRERTGYVSGNMLANRENGKAEIIAIWETQPDMEAGEAGGYYREQVARVSPILAGTPIREVYEVIHGG